jgi:hypothetical protein
MKALTNDGLQGKAISAPPHGTEEALMPLAICLFPNCVGITSVDWISPPTARCLLLGPRRAMFDWLDDVFDEAREGSVELHSLEGISA